MTIYTLEENHISCDNNSWEHRLESSVISYHETPQGATDKMNNLLLTKQGNNILKGTKHEELYFISSVILEK